MFWITLEIIFNRRSIMDLNLENVCSIFTKFSAINFDFMKKIEYRITKMSDFSSGRLRRRDLVPTNEPQDVIAFSYVQRVRDHVEASNWIPSGL